MTGSEYDLFLSVAAFLCAIGAVLNLMKLKRRGSAAFILSAAFLVMAGLIWMVKVHASQNLITVAGIALGGLLVVDVIVRSRQQDRPL